MVTFTIGHFWASSSVCNVWADFLRRGWRWPFVSRRISLLWLQIVAGVVVVVFVADSPSSAVWCGPPRILWQQTPHGINTILSHIMEASFPPTAQRWPYSFQLLFKCGLLGQSLETGVRQPGQISRLPNLAPDIVLRDRNNYLLMNWIACPIRVLQPWWNPIYHPTCVNSSNRLQDYRKH